MRLLAMGLILLAPLLVGTSMSATPLEEHPNGSCSSQHYVHGSEWDFCWQQDDVRGQGLELNQLYFHGESVLWKIGIPFSITRYDGGVAGPFKDVLGAASTGGNNSGFGGGSMQIHPLDCPRFLGRGELLDDRHICVERRDGREPAVAIWGRYNNFNYRFLQGYILDARGVIEPFVRLGGILIDGDDVGAEGFNHMHQIYWRADFDISGADHDALQTYLQPTDVRRPGHPPLVPAECRNQVRAGETGWCTLNLETSIVDRPELLMKWRVSEETETNMRGRLKSFESYIKSDGVVDYNFTLFDALAQEYKGDSQEIGFEVPSRPVGGDAYLMSYQDPPEEITDPVIWFSVRAHHDTRDEDMPTMTYHHISFRIQPRNFLSENLGEDSSDARMLIPSQSLIQPPINTSN